MELYFCPNCGAPTVDTPALVGGEASCRSCKWAGPATSLIADGSPVPGPAYPKASVDDTEDTLRAFVTDFSLEFSKHCAAPIAKLLLKWGFLPPAAERVTMVALLNRYMRAIALAACQAVVRERELIVKEAHERKVNAS